MSVAGRSCWRSICSPPTPKWRPRALWSCLSTVCVREEVIGEGTVAGSSLIILWGGGGPPVEKTASPLFLLLLCWFLSLLYWLSWPGWREPPQLGGGVHQVIRHNVVQLCKITSGSASLPEGVNTNFQEKCGNNWKTSPHSRCWTVQTCGPCDPFHPMAKIGFLTQFQSFCNLCFFVVFLCFFSWRFFDSSWNRKIPAESGKKNEKF